MTLAHDVPRGHFESFCVRLTCSHDVQQKGERWRLVVLLQSLDSSRQSVMFSLLLLLLTGVPRNLLYACMCPLCTMRCDAVQMTPDKPDELGTV